eukprot:453969-Prymnesium_polylepis.1
MCAEVRVVPPQRGVVPPQRGVAPGAAAHRFVEVSDRKAQPAHVEPHAPRVVAHALGAVVVEDVKLVRDHIQRPLLLGLLRAEQPREEAGRRRFRLLLLAFAGLAYAACRRVRRHVRDALEAVSQVDATAGRALPQELQRLRRHEGGAAPPHTCLDHVPRHAILDRSRYQRREAVQPALPRHRERVCLLAVIWPLAAIHDARVRVVELIQKHVSEERQPMRVDVDVQPSVPHVQGGSQSEHPTQDGSHALEGRWSAPDDGAAALRWSVRARSRLLHSSALLV